MRIRRIRSRMAKEERNVDTRRDLVAKPTSALTEAEAAHYIGMSRTWLKKSRTRRFRRVIDAPPFVRAGARRIVYRREDLDVWQQRHLECVGPSEPQSVEVGSLTTTLISRE
jgi:predicted DNA-binding transcriptional regulator AlpA